MAKGKGRIDRSTTGGDASAPADSPFAALAGLRAQLPEGEAPAPVTDDPITDDKASVRSAKVVVRRERSGRGGKTVTLVEQLGWPPGELERLSKKMKKALGCGARVEGDAVLLQGDLEERAAAWLEAEQVAKRVVRATALPG